MRSRVHMLTVAAACIEHSHGSQKLVADLRAVANEEAGKLARGEVRNRAFKEEEDRIAKQRNLFTFLPDTRATDKLREGMMQRAYDLMWDGMCTECDAILEFVPSKYAEEVLNAWERDQEGKEKSRFYNG